MPEVSQGLQTPSVGWILAKYLEIFGVPEVSQVLHCWVHISL